MSGALVVVEHEASAGASLMTDGLGPDVRVVRPYLGEPLPELSELAGLLVLGGSVGAWDDEAAPWLPATRNLLRDAVQNRLPTLGICLGAQLLAAACGGTVERGADGLELGLVPVMPLPAAHTDPFFGRVQRAVSEDREAPWLVHQYHYDAVTELPAEAELMVTGTAYPHQGFRVGPAAWGVQYHPEVSTGLFTEWVEGELRTGGLPADAVHVLGPVRDASAAQSLLAGAHATAFLDVVSSTEAVRGLR
jgi:GMP synthase-like glutamine amidotransferase